MEEGKARGFARHTLERRKEIARKGGLKLSENKEHMSAIGKKGGASLSKDREHMAELGRKSVAAKRARRSCEK